MIVGDLFCGGGGSSIGALMAGAEIAWGIDNDQGAADCYEMNLGRHIIRRPVQDVDPKTLSAIDALICSPPCPAFSAARSTKLAPRDDGWLGLAIIPYLETLRPQVFILENVPPYLTTGWPILSQIVACLWRLGYTVDWSIINAADMGVAQTRSRLFVRAVRGGLLPALPAPTAPWIGWYAAIEDLIPTLPESRLAPWQAARLARHPVYGSLLLHGFSHSDAIPRQGRQPSFTVAARSNPVRALLVDGRNSGRADGDRSITARPANQPAPTLSNPAKGGFRALLLHPTSVERFPVRADADPSSTITVTHGMPRALLVSGTDAAIRTGAEPACTVTASLHTHTAIFRALLEEARCVALTPRALARLQSFPDSYILPERRVVACRVLGNAVSPLVMKTLIRDLTAVDRWEEPA